MKTLSSDMQAMVAGKARTLEWAVQITRADGQVFRYVSGARDTSIDGQTFEAMPGFNLSSITCSLGYDVDTLELTVLTTSDLEQADFLAGRWNHARVDFNQYNWKDTTDGFIPWPSYRVANVEPILGGFKLELRDLRQLWRQDYSLFTSKTCANRLGDDKCGVDLGPFTHTFTVTSVASRIEFTASGLLQAADYFTNGIVTFDTGLHAGLDLLVTDHEAGGVIHLGVPVIEDITVGQTGTIVAGCQKRREDCKTKFNNILNLRAFPDASSSNKIAGG